MAVAHGSVDPEEIARFGNDSENWWDESGPFAPLHRLNPVRLHFIRDEIIHHFSLPDDRPKPFKGLKILDIGCGGGLVCEPLSRLGGTITGIDADPQAVKTAQRHAEDSDLKIKYIGGKAEDIKKETFDIVLALEIIEHVTDAEEFIKTCALLCKPGGLIILSTLNKTIKSKLLGIYVAEYILNWVPKGTHQWEKFISPAHLSGFLRNCDVRPVNQKGLIFNPLRNEFQLSDKDFDVNYLISGIKQ